MKSRHSIFFNGYCILHSYFHVSFFSPSPSVCTRRSFVNLVSHFSRKLFTFLWFIFWSTILWKFMRILRLWCFAAGQKFLILRCTATSPDTRQSFVVVVRRKASRMVGPSPCRNVYIPYSVTCYIFFSLYNAFIRLTLVILSCIYFCVSFSFFLLSVCLSR